MIFSSIISFISTNWSKWGNLFCVILGAIISGIVSSFFTRKRELKRLKIDIEIKTIEEYINLVADFRNSIFEIFDVLDINEYNTRIQSKRNGDPFRDGVLVTIEEKDIGENYSKIFSELISDMIKNWNILYQSFFKIIVFFETKDMIIHKFIKRVDLIEHWGYISNAYHELYLQATTVLLQMQGAKSIKAMTINDIAEKRNIFNTEIGKINLVLYEINTNLQNRILSKLFGGYKIQPESPFTFTILQDISKEQGKVQPKAQK